MSPNRIERWLYDNKGYYCYVLIKSLEPIYRKTLKILTDNGVAVRHYGKSYRPAYDGFQYDWFIRINEEPNSKEHISRLFKDNDLLPGESFPDISKILDQNKQIEGELAILKTTYQKLNASYNLLNKEKREIEISFNKNVVESSALKKEINELKRELKRQNTIIDSYKKAYEELLNKRTPNKSEMEKEKKYDLSRLAIFKIENKSLKNKIDNLLKENKEIKDTSEKALAGWIKEYTQKIEKIEKDLEEEKEKNGILLERLNCVSGVETNQESTRIKHSSQTWEGILSLIVSYFMPNKKLLPGSMEKILVEYNDIAKAIDIINNVDNSPRKFRSCKVQGAEGWFETHLDYDWRLYFKKAEDAWWIYIGLKKEQPQDIKYLAAN